MIRRLLLAFAISRFLIAHPMGNFSVNHYSRLQFAAKGAQLTYVLDLAEIPTFQLMQQWGVDAKNPAAVAAKARLQAAEWLSHVTLTENGDAASLRLTSVTPSLTDGAAGMPVLRVEMRAEAALSAGEAAYADGNFEGRAGWKEIVVTHSAGARIESSTKSSDDLSAGLTRYPADPTLAPPQDLTARVVWAPLETAPPTLRTAAPLAPPVAAPPRPRRPRPRQPRRPPSSPLNSRKARAPS